MLMKIFLWLMLIVLLIIAYALIESEIKHRITFGEWSWHRAKPTERIERNVYYLVDTENADRVKRYYKEDLVENDEYYLSAKELKENYDHERVWKYEPVKIPFKIEGNNVFTEIEGDWFKIGRLKKGADLDGELTCYFYVKEYKYVTEDSIEKEKDDDFFGIEVKKRIAL